MDGHTDGQTDRQDQYCGLLGRLRNKQKKTHHIRRTRT